MKFNYQLPNRALSSGSHSDSGQPKWSQYRCYCNELWMICSVHPWSGLCRLSTPVKGRQLVFNGCKKKKKRSTFKKRMISSTWLLFDPQVWFLPLALILFFSPLFSHWGCSVVDILWQTSKAMSERVRSLESVFYLWKWAQWCSLDLHIHMMNSLWKSCSHSYFLKVVELPRGWQLKGEGQKAREWARVIGLVT